ncbi:MAG: NADH:ubiquinone oxidoreductase subunit N, partial [Candidatus Omnitrophica bacterium]|nr:NADH:ubiquinone oxidoreductase subunit N [Candidatus Omnitrophota bacterium]
AVNSAVAVFYYFKVVKEMYFTPPADWAPIEEPFHLVMALVITFVGVVAVGDFPVPLIELVRLSLPF